MSSSPPLVVADRYRLVAPLGQGGMGRVWRATDVVLHRDVAIKELVPPPGLTPGERQEMRERSLREARAIARLNNVNVVRVFDVLRTDADPWIVMEYVASRSLHDVLASDGPFPPVRAAEIGLGVLGALRAAHRAGVVHRDVKPGNVLIAADGRVVLTDFGLATVPGDPNVTRTGLVLGSPAYIAPERARDGTAGPAADLWSLGATLYAAVEGASPFARPSAIATLAALATENPPPSRNAGPLKPVLNGLLRKDPTHRINAEEAERLLLRATGRRSKLSFPMSPTMRRPGVGRERPALPPTGATPVVPGPRPPVAPSRAANPPGQTPVSDGRAVTSDGRPPVFVPGKAPVGRSTDQPTRVDAPKVDASRLDPTRVDGPPVRDGQPPFGTRPASPPSPRPSAGPAPHEVDPALARTVRGGGPGGFTAADVAAARRKRAAPEHEQSLADAAAAMTVADATTVVPPTPDHARPGRQPAAPADATTVVPPVSDRPRPGRMMTPSADATTVVPAPATKGRRAPAADATTIVPAPARPKSPAADATTVVPRPAKPTVQPAPDATTVVPPPATPDVPAADSTTVVPPPAKPPTADATTVVPRPARQPASPATAAEPTVTAPAEAEPAAATTADDAQTAPDQAAAVDMPAATRSGLTKRQRRNRSKTPPVVAAEAANATGAASAAATASAAAMTTDDAESTTDEAAPGSANEPAAAEAGSPATQVGESETDSTPGATENDESATAGETEQAETQTSQHESGLADNSQAEGASGEASQDEAAQDEAAQDEAAQDEAAQDEAAQDETSLDRAAHGETSLDEAAQGDASLDEAAQGGASLDEGAQGETRQDESSRGETGQDEGGQDEGSRNGVGVDRVAAGDEGLADTVEGAPAAAGTASAAAGSDQVGLPPARKRKHKNAPADEDAAAAMPSNLPPFSPAARPAWKPMQVSAPVRKAGITIFGTRLTYRQAAIGGAALLVILLLVIVLAVKAFGGGDDKPAANPTARTTAAKSGKAALPVGTPSGAPSGTPSATTPPSSAPPTTPSTPASAPATGGTIALPAGWKWYNRPTQGSYPGFTIPIPQNASVSPDGSQIYLRWNNRLLIVDRTNAPQADPVQDWKNQEANRTYRDYQKIKIVPVNYFKAGADWEFTYTTDNGNAQHADKRNVLVSASAAYSLNWYTTPADWAASQSDLQLLYRGFQPKP